MTERSGAAKRPTAFEFITATIQPSAILRMPDRAQRQEARDFFLDDLRKIAERLHS